MDIEFLRKNNLIIFECISGSRAYGLNTPESDTDIKGVFILPREMFFGFKQVEQVSNPTNDIVFYELKKFMEMLARNNPNILEMLYTPEDCILHHTSFFEKINKEQYLSRLCEKTFVQYAMGQIKKARGLNKKIVNPMSEKRLGILDFCYVMKGNGSEKLGSWLSENGFNQSDCGLSRLPHFPNMYCLYHSRGVGLRGVVSGENSDSILTSSIPKELPLLTTMVFNENAYREHCRQHRDYWNWVRHRNESRFETNFEHGRNYDSKNLMHVFRLLYLAEGIARNNKIDLRGHDREFLLQVKAGKFDYDELVSRTEEKIAELETQFQSSDLPETPDLKRIENLLAELRNEFYQSNSN